MIIELVHFKRTKDSEWEQGINFNDGEKLYNLNGEEVTDFSIWDIERRNLEVPDTVSISIVITDGVPKVSVSPEASKWNKDGMLDRRYEQAMEYLKTLMPGSGSSTGRRRQADTSQ